MKIKTSEGINIKRFIANLKGDLLTEGLKNADEALLRTVVKFFRVHTPEPNDPPTTDDAVELVSKALAAGPSVTTRQLEALAAPYHGMCLVVFINDGKPGAFSIKEFCDNYITIGAEKLAEFGKSNDVNFGKGHTTFYQGICWGARTGRISAMVRDPDNIDVNDDAIFLSGTMVVIALKLSHSLARMMDDDITTAMAGFSSTASYYHDGKKVTTMKITLDDHDQVANGVYCKYGVSYNGFRLANGTIAPVHYGNIPQKTVSVIVTNINAVDTERSSLEWEYRYAVEEFARDKAYEEALRGNEGLAGLDTLLKDATARFMSICTKLGASVSPPRVTKFLDLCSLLTLSGDLNKLGNLKVDEIAVVTHLDKAQSIVFERHRASLAECLETFGYDMHEMLANIKVGVIIEDGEQKCVAYARDFEEVERLVVMMSDDDTMENFTNTTTKFIALSSIGEDVFRQLYPDDIIKDIKDIMDLDGNVTTAPTIPFSWYVGDGTGDRIADPGDLFKDCTLGGMSCAKKSKWTPTTVAGTPFLVEAKEIREWESPSDHVADKRDLENASLVFHAMKACIKKVLEYKVFGKMPRIAVCCYSSDSKDKNADAFTFADIIAISAIFKYPDIKEASIYTFLRVAIHEMTHLATGLSHGNAMHAAENHYWRQALSKRGLVSAIRKDWPSTE